MHPMQKIPVPEKPPAKNTKGENISDIPELWKQRSRDRTADAGIAGKEDMILGSI
jgi:hypothetical protein